MSAFFMGLILNTIISLMLFINISEAQVWQHESKKEWNKATQIKYSNWVSSKLGSDFFNDLGRPFSSLRLDCADAHYALLAYFSKQEGLPFAIDNGNLNNLTTRFNDISNLDARFVAFVRYIAGSYGTESLSHADTYPISFKTLRPGDLFMYKIGSSGGYTRHTYILKNINPDGTFDVVYSTQADAKAGRPLRRRPSYMFNHAPSNTGSDKNYWGFRRQKPSELSATAQEQIPGADFSQYDLARLYRNEPLSFFREVKQANQSVTESPQMLITRNLNNICGSLNDRIDIVTEAQNFLGRTNNQCMAFQDFDAYSTPSRDSGLGDEFLTLAYDFNDIVDRGRGDRIGNNLFVIAQAALDKQRNSNQDQSLTTFCKVEFTSGVDGYTNIGRFFDALFDGDVSFHPNDNIYRRWGYDEGRRTSCLEHYGYARPLVRM